MRSGKIVASRANSFGGFNLEVEADMSFVVGETLHFTDSASPWQPIETAPKDKWVLVFSQYDGCHVACWDYAGEFWRDNERGQFEDPVPIEEPTHWMPLPEPPKLARPWSSPVTSARH